MVKVGANVKPLVVENLVKRFGEFTAVNGITFSVEPGETFGVLGPNGAGKSSTMKMISTVSPRTGGELKVFGLDPQTHGREIRSKLGIVPQQDLLDVQLSVRDNLRIYQRYFGVAWKQTEETADRLLGFMNLSDKADEQVEHLSGGMKRRLTIARALVSDPRMVLLDEPTTGLDPQARHLLWERLYNLKESGVTLLLTTHYMDEAEQLSDRLVIMDGGKIVAEGTPSGLIRRYSTREVLELRFPTKPAGSGDKESEQYRTQITKQLTEVCEPLGFGVDPLPDRWLVYANDGDEALEALTKKGIEPSGTYVRRSTLEDVFLKITGRSLNE